MGWAEGRAEGSEAVVRLVGEIERGMTSRREPETLRLSAEGRMSRRYASESLVGGLGTSCTPVTSSTSLPVPAPIQVHRRTVGRSPGWSRRGRWTQMQRPRLRLAPRKGTDGRLTFRGEPERWGGQCGEPEMRRRRRRSRYSHRMSDRKSTGNMQKSTEATTPLRARRKCKKSLWPRTECKFSRPCPQRMVFVFVERTVASYMRGRPVDVDSGRPQRR
ncbi:hypothetical protein C8F01DRAFT_1143252 [Mycena amicta]|nr:hypothetical protein C8F01DRAFT_1143252 [Mycena amicta]